MTVPLSNDLSTTINNFGVLRVVVVQGFTVHLPYCSEISSNILSEKSAWLCGEWHLTNCALIWQISAKQIWCWWNCIAFLSPIPVCHFLIGAQNLVKSTPVGKFTNILRAAFLPMFLCKKKLYSPTYKKLHVYLSYEKTAHKMLVKLTLDKLNEFRIVS